MEIVEGRQQEGTRGMPRVLSLAAAVLAGGCGWGPVWWLTWIKGLLVEKALKIKEMGEMLLNTQRLKPPKVQGVGGNPDTGR